MTFRRMYFFRTALPRKNTYVLGTSTHDYTLDYKNRNFLRRYIGATGKILPRHVTKISAKEQRMIAKAIRRARRVRLLPFVWITY
jgi:small subunit ribosomal protein S18